jgi:hypothetical protein
MILLPDPPRPAGSPRKTGPHSVNATSPAVATESVAKQIVTVDRRRNDRRTAQEASATPRPIINKPSKKGNRRRHIDPTTCERDYRQDEIDFMRAMDDYKRAAGRMFPTCSEVLEVVRSMGYVRLTDEQIEMLGDTLSEPMDQYEGDEEDEDLESEDEEVDFE